PDAERAHLADLAQTARGVVDDLRDAIWIVDAGHDSLPALVARLEQCTESMLRGRRYAFRCPDALPPVALGMEARRHLYLLFREALHNAVRHGDPKYVEVVVRYVSGRFHLSIVDDGGGFELATAQRGRGLTTMQTRAEALRGTLDIDSTVGGGTTISLQLPMG
ncbi:MAG: ATP-binding protein, partial [Bacteroidota bacterium]